ncbi:hypothetical protein THTE_0630 [Thermogutta terrifontis]|uniref:Uncharacterized protein n=1 Tax=Thermogutta terrifontis TaxID=1331910 RepID=A0A286RB97_9BACT|nr:hypothetical protein THTE_0630 [Thermogutta terrifontis]
MPGQTGMDYQRLKSGRDKHVPPEKPDLTNRSLRRLDM